ncbi:MAG: pyridoxal phosphate-dependent aminotransferase [Clostridia bacterium]|nr:pyridoxal phosphate-dependent aminotransferase [Clostridia bacterium]
MKKYDFDKLTDRRKFDTLKWDMPEGTLPMWVADMDFECAPAIRAAIEARAAHGIFGYSDVPKEYFESVSGFFERLTGYRHDPEDMIFSTGVVAIISSCVRKLTTPAEKVLIQAPVYNIFYNSILNNGRVVVSSDLVYENGEYHIDFADLEEKMSDPQTTLMILCNPHNPVGKIWSKEELRKIGELAYEHGVRVISDEIHFPLTDPGKTCVPFASVSEKCRTNSVTCVSASKAFNLAGIGAACAIVPDKKLHHKVWRGINTDEVGEPNAFAVSASIAAYTKCDEWLAEVREYIAENKKYCYDFIENNIPALKVVRGEATYLMWVDASEFTDDSVRLQEEIFEKTGLYVSSGRSYGECGKCFLRINLATSRANVIDGMDRLKRALSG